MASGLVSRMVFTCPQGLRRTGGRTASFHSRPQAFSPAARRVVCQAGPMTSSSDLDEPVEVVVEGVDPADYDEAYEEAVAAAEEVLVSYYDELLDDADMASDALKEKATRRAEAALEEILGTPSGNQLAAALVDSETGELAADDVEDISVGGGKYDEEAAAGMSQEEREAVAPYKLTKSELVQLVPQDWDTINIDWFSSKREDNITLPEYKLSFLWSEKNIAVAVDQVYSRGQISPLTEFFFWPRKDAWEELKASLETRPWISERDKVVLLNRLTEVINFWQDENTKHSVDEARGAFPDCAFSGA